jgi:hypothetical protein
MSKAYQFATNDDKVYVRFEFVKCERCLNQSTKKENHMGKKFKLMHIGVGKKHALKVAPKVENSCQDKVYQQETLEFKQIILLCYGRRKTPI